MNRIIIPFFSLCVVSTLVCVEEEGFKPRGIEQQKNIPELPRVSEPTLASANYSRETEQPSTELPFERKSRISTNTPEIQEPEETGSLAPLTNNKLLLIQKEVPSVLDAIDASANSLTIVASPDTQTRVEDVQDLLTEIHKKLPSANSLTKLIQETGPSKKLNLPTNVMDALIRLNGLIDMLTDELEKLITPQKSSIPIDRLATRQLTNLATALNSFSSLLRQE